MYQTQMTCLQILTKLTTISSTAQYYTTQIHIRIHLPRVLFVKDQPMKKKQNVSFKQF